MRVSRLARMRLRPWTLNSAQEQGEKNEETYVLSLTLAPADILSAFRVNAR